MTGGQAFEIDMHGLRQVAVTGAESDQVISPDQSMDEADREALAEFRSAQIPQRAQPRAFVASPAQAVVQAPRATTKTTPKQLIADAKRHLVATRRTIKGLRRELRALEADEKALARLLDAAGGKKQWQSSMVRSEASPSSAQPLRALERAKSG